MNHVPGRAATVATEILAASILDQSIEVVLLFPVLGAVALLGALLCAVGAFRPVQLHEQPINLSVDVDQLPRVADLLAGDADVTIGADGRARNSSRHCWER